MTPQREATSHQRMCMSKLEFLKLENVKTTLCFSNVIWATLDTVEKTSNFQRWVSHCCENSHLKILFQSFNYYFTSSEKCNNLVQFPAQAWQNQKTNTPKKILKGFFKKFHPKKIHYTFLKNSMDFMHQPKVDIEKKKKIILRQSLFLTF